MDKGLLRIVGLKTYFHTFSGLVKAVDEVDFSLEEGEILGVVGESGCGKSVVGFSIMGLIDAPGRIESGKILFNGVNLLDLDERDMRKVRGKEITMIFQDPMTSLNPLYTIQAQMEEGMKLHTAMNGEQRKLRCIELLDAVGISQPESRLKNYPHQFSGGMRQRVVIALALCVNPRLIVADEPTTALDVSIQAQIISLLKRLCREHGAAVMLVTHDMGVIAETADRVAVMYAGRLVEIGPVRDVVKNAQHPYTEGLMGSIPLVGHDVERLTQIDGAMPRLNAIPSGCAYHPRCPKVFDRCQVDRPQLSPSGPNEAACWLRVPGAKGA